MKKLWLRCEFMDLIRKLVSNIILRIDIFYLLIKYNEFLI